VNTRISILLVIATLLATGPAWADPSGKIRLPNLAALEARASETVEVTLDAALLGMASRFLDAKNPEEAGVREIVNGLQGVYVRSYTFDEPFTPQKADVDMVRSQLTAPGWSRIVGAQPQGQYQRRGLHPGVGAAGHGTRGAGDRAQGVHYRQYRRRH